MPKLVEINRYPVKSLPADSVDHADIVAGQGMPGDRLLAITTGAKPFDPAPARFWPKTDFLTVMGYPAMAALGARYDMPAGRVQLAVPGEAGQALALRDPGLADAMKTYLQLPADWQPRLVVAGARRFADAGVESPRLGESLSLINLATLRDIESRIGIALDPRRFRANFYIDDAAPWVEFDWLDQQFRIGGTDFTGLVKTPRCLAIDANPATGLRERPLLKEFRAAYGHGYCGIQIEANNSGPVRLGDTLVA